VPGYFSSKPLIGSVVVVYGMALSVFPFPCSLPDSLVYHGLLGTGNGRSQTLRASVPWRIAPTNFFPFPYPPASLPFLFLVSVVGSLSGQRRFLVYPSVCMLSHVPYPPLFFPLYFPLFFLCARRQGRDAARGAVWVIPLCNSQFLSLTFFVFPPFFLELQEALRRWQRKPPPFLQTPVPPRK